MPVPFTCPQCGRVQMLPPSTAAVRQHCSVSCRSQHQHESRLVEFWGRVDKSGGPDACWPFTGVCFSTGYGAFSSHAGNVGAHRFAYEATFGEIPEGSVVMHRCDNPPCCNPAHLVAGSQGDNVRDAVSKLRFSLGSRNYSSKYKEEQIREVKKMLRSGVKQIETSRRLGVSYAVVHGVASGRAWRWLDAEVKS